MVGEVETVSTTFSFFRGGLFWIGGFAVIFLTIVVIASLLDSANTSGPDRSASRGAASRPVRGAEPSMGLTPQTVAP